MKRANNEELSNDIKFHGLGKMKGHEEYIKAIFLLERDQSEAEKLVRTSQIADFLNIMPPSATEMLQKLSRKGMVSYKPYGGVKLTPKGREIALRLVRNNEVLDRFFVEVLGLDSAVSKKEACKLEHFTSNEVIERINNLLKDKQD